MSKVKNFAFHNDYAPPLAIVGPAVVRPAGDVPTLPPSAASSQHLLRPKTGFRANKTPARASKPCLISKTPLVWAALSGGNGGRLGALIDWALVGLRPYPDQILGKYVAG